MKNLDKELMTVSQMEDALEARPNKKLGNYKAESTEFKAEALAADISSKMSGLKNIINRPRANLHDLTQVQTRAFEYLEACMKAAAFPSVMGLATMAYGYSPQGLNKYLRENPEAASAQFIEMLKSTFADILTNQSLYRNADTAQAIFQLKNQNGFTDKVQIEPVQQNTDPLAAVTDPEERRRRIWAAVVDDE